jgi:hypothetical protein
MSKGKNPFPTELKNTVLNKYASAKEYDYMGNLEYTFLGLAIVESVLIKLPIIESTTF